MKTGLPAKAEEFERFFEEQFRPVYNYVRFRLGNPEAAEDLTAEIFLRAYLYWESFSREGNRGAWLRGITRNTLKTHLKRTMRRPHSVELFDSISADVDIEGDFIRKEDLRLLLSHVARLPDEKQELLAMKYFLRMTNREIAKATGMSESNTGSTLHRIITELR
ncbi:MAG: sigma-70 family RNA polymerase sigma factor, partial [Oscillospiraceae bacterium]|nr:sigma-70 family RNA polymerase sigma factor [Oscillospiraceae bacterium]